MEVTETPTQRGRFAGRASRLAVAATLGALSLALVAGPASAQDFTNSTAITTPLPNPPAGCPFPNGCPSEKASPYPSTITVGMSGTVGDVNVTLHDFTYPLKPADVDMLLVAPGGRSVMLMSDACGDNSTANENPITTPIELTFDDSAATQLPADSRCSSGTFRPIDDDDDTDEFGFHQQPDDTFTDGPTAPAGTLPLSTFNGIDPSGTWSLYVVDDYPNDPNPNGFAGRIGSWTLSITASGTSTQVITTVPGQTTTTLATSQATTVTTVAGATTTTTRATTSTTRAATTSTTAPLPKSGANSGPMAMVAALLVATGVALVRAAGPEQRRRRRRKSMVYIVHWH